MNFLNKIINFFIILIFLKCEILTSSSVSHGHSRIIGGEPTTIKKFPFIVSLQAEEKPFHFCAGSIISDKWILTAAHCVLQELSYYIRVGSTYTYEGGVIYDVSRVIRHPNFKEETFDSDIALLELYDPITISSGAAIINLPSIYNENTQNVQKYDLVTITGWGETRDWYIIDDKLRYTQIYIMDFEQCAKNFSETSTNLTSTMFCAGFPGGKRDACKGDSGGPVVFNDTIIGIVSFGEGCADEKFPGVYTNVSVLYNWIHDLTGLY